MDRGFGGREDRKTIAKRVEDGERRSQEGWMAGMERSGGAVEVKGYYDYSELEGLIEDIE